MVGCQGEFGRLDALGGEAQIREGESGSESAGGGGGSIRRGIS